MAKAKRRMVQDDERQKQIADLCGLTLVGARSGVDAVDGAGHRFELKSTTTKTVSTARDTGLHTIAKWRTQYWIIASGESLQKGFEIEHLFICHPEELQPFLDKQEGVLRGRLNTFRRVIRAAKRGGARPTDIEFVIALFDRRGNTINNPAIPLKLVAEVATELDASNEQKVKLAIRRFVKRKRIKEVPI